MINHIDGKLVDKTPTNVVIDCNGVGYSINISLQTFSKINDERWGLVHREGLSVNVVHAVRSIAGQGRRSAWTKRFCEHKSGSISLMAIASAADNICNFTPRVYRLGTRYTGENAVLTLTTWLESTKCSLTPLVIFLQTTPKPSRMMFARAFW